MIPFNLVPLLLVDIYVGIMFMIKKGSSKKLETDIESVLRI